MSHGKEQRKTKNTGPQSQKVIGSSGDTMLRCIKLCRTRRPRYPGALRYPAAKRLLVRPPSEGPGLAFIFDFLQQIPGQWLTPIKLARGSPEQLRLIPATRELWPGAICCQTPALASCWVPQAHGPSLLWGAGRSNGRGAGEGLH
jgi:hypothetical protein